ncbi:MAG TPA: hypothetical protein PLV72_00925 [Candidatus Magasanikbacteria bacterium]|nr:hypothetical protein [Candidatus Magasanikbacteria bacterium]
MPMTKEKFNKAGNLIGFWIYTAQNLLNSSNFLKANDSSVLFMKGQECLDEKEESFRNFLSVSRMLRGMAFECFLKAVLIKKTKIKITDGEIEKNQHNQHDLVKMAEDAEIKLNKLEKESLKILTSDIVLGRYPILKKYTKYANLPQIPNVKPKVKGRYWNDELEEESIKLLKRIKVELA